MFLDITNSSILPSLQNKFFIIIHVYIVLFYQILNDSFSIILVYARWSLLKKYKKTEKMSYNSFSLFNNKLAIFIFLTYTFYLCKYVIKKYCKYPQQINFYSTFNIYSVVERDLRPSELSFIDVHLIVVSYFCMQTLIIIMKSFRYDKYKYKKYMAHNYATFAQ